MASIDHSVFIAIPIRWEKKSSTLFKKEELLKGSSAVFVHLILWVFIKERYLILK